MSQRDILRALHRKTKLAPLVECYWELSANNRPRKLDARCSIFAGEQAKRCRTLSKIITEPEVIEQLRVWAGELAEEAKQAEWRAAEREETIVSV